MSPLSVNAGEYKSKIGLDSLYIAEVTVDTAAAYTADTPEYLAPAAEASQAPATNASTQYADDQPYDSIVFEGETVISLTVTGLPPEMQAKLLGRQFDAVSGRVFDNPGATPPYFALSFRSLKSNGSYRYYQYFKGRFSAPSEETATKADSPAPKTMSLTYTAIPTIYNFDIGATNEPVKRVYGDEDTDNFSATGWFTAVQTPSIAAASALALSTSDPADGATGVATSKIITLTFNNALTADAIYNVTVATAAGVLKACTNVLDATKKIMTITPGTALAGSTTYLISMGVTDIYGQSLLKVNDFATV